MEEYLLAFLACTAALDAAILQVGPDKPFQAPCAAIAVASPGDAIEIDAGLYRRDVCVIRQYNLTLRGINGRAHLEAEDASAQGKAIWVIHANDVVVENIEFSGASVPDQNGAGIRAEGMNLTVRNCYFHDNQDGILESNVAGSNILIEFSEFDHNGFGTGQAHNLYIGHAGSLTFRFNWSHRAKVGHLLKSRASQNYIYFNRLTDETGNSSYEIDLPNGGSSYVIGNLIEQGKNTGNSTILSYLEEGVSLLTAGKDLHVINNSFVNDRPAGGIFIHLASAADSAVVTNNIFAGPGAVCDQPNATLTANFVGNPLFVDASGFDYHLTAASPAIDQGSDTGPLTPAFQYLHPACGEERVATGAGIDIGAYEFGGAGAALGAGNETLMEPNIRGERNCSPTS
jgi:hypothetical protein